jgi:hypothetical protein
MDVLAYLTSLLREDLAEARQRRTRGQREVKTGDPTFDREFFVASE